MAAKAEASNDTKGIQDAMKELSGLMSDLDKFLSLMKKQVAEINKNPDECKKVAEQLMGELVGIAKSGKDFDDIAKRLGKAVAK